MSADPNNLHAPIPRNQSGPTESELIPFRSTKINIWKSKALIPLVLVALAVVALFSTMSRPILFIEVFGWCGVIAIFLGIYFYSGMQKQWWWYFVPAVIAYLLLQHVFGVYATFFRHVLPGNVTAVKDNPNFIPNFIAYFFGAGLCEEGLKATPTILALLLTVRLGAAPTGPTPGPKDLVIRKPGSPSIFAALALRGPLDGLLMGFAAGAAFIIDETLGEYVPGQIQRVFNSSHDQGLALLAGLELLIPRILQGVSGHMAWAGIFGYFIGLTAKYPKRWFELVLIGYLTAAVLHGLWDSIGTLPYPVVWEVVLSLITVLIFVGCLLKAKQLEIAAGGAASYGDSILVRTPATAEFATAPAAAGAAFAGSQATASGSQGPAAGNIKPATSVERYSIGAGSSRFGLEAGRFIDFGALFGANGAPAGATGEIGPHPSDPRIFGLKNTGAAAWTATTPDGATITVPPGRSLTIAAGTRLLFGSLVLDIQTY